MYVCMYIQYIQGLCQSRLSTANHALLLISPATTAVLLIATPVLVIISGHRPHRKHRSVVACMYVVGVT
jgi:hypothetical protein